MEAGLFMAKLIENAIQEATWSRSIILWLLDYFMAVG